MQNGIELTLNVTQFRARCLRLFDDIAAGRISRIYVTRRGKPLAVITAAQPEAEVAEG